MENSISRLTELGLSEYEARAYIALLKDNPSTAYEIARSSGIPTSKVYEVIRRLEYRQMIQSIRGERSRLFIPIALDEFIHNFRTGVENNLRALKAELKGLVSSIDTSYTWHIKDRNSLIQRAKRMIDTARETLLMQIWPEEMKELLEPLLSAEKRGLRMAIVHYGATNIRIKELYRHPAGDTIFAQKGSRGFTLVADSKEALIGKIGDRDTEAIWSMNEGFTMMAEDYIRHDIYFMKLAERFDPLLRERFGSRYEKLRDIYNDEEI